MKARRSTRSTSTLLGLIAVIAIVASSCNIADWGAGGAERPWWCDPTDTAINDGHGDHPPPYTEEKGPLTAVECGAIDYWLDKAVTFVEQFPTQSVAEANGWTQLAPWIPGQGTHHVDDSYGIPSQFDPTRPTMLMFDNDSQRSLTGMVYLVASGSEPPEGWPGNNDHWHAHHKLCFRNGGVIGDNISDEDCAAAGGVQVDTSGIWLLHVWLPTYDGWQATDIFNKNHPNIN